MSEARRSCIHSATDEELGVMGHRLPQELLQELRTYLQHFDQTGHLGESATVEEIKRRLRERIGEVEAQVRNERRDDYSYKSTR